MRVAWRPRDTNSGSSSSIRRGPDSLQRTRDRPGGGSVRQRHGRIQNAPLKCSSRVAHTHVVLQRPDHDDGGLLGREPGTHRNQRQGNHQDEKRRPYPRQYDPDLRAAGECQNSREHLPVSLGGGLRFVPCGPPAAGCLSTCGGWCYLDGEVRWGLRERCPCPCRGTWTEPAGAGRRSCVTLRALLACVRAGNLYGVRVLQENTKGGVGPSF